MKTTALSLLIWAFFFHLGWAQDDILIKDVQIVHADKGKVEGPTSIHISNGLIQKIGKVNENTLPKSTEVIEAEGKFLMHGMIDAHVHFFQSGGIYTRPDALDLRKLVPYEEEQNWLIENAPDLMKRYTAAGITHLCDVGGPMQNYNTRDQADGLESAPKLFVTGPLISTYQPDAFKIDDPPIIKINNAEEARALVQKQLPFKPDFIKIWYIVGLGQTALSNYPIVEATIDESHKNGVKVAVHATQLNTAKLAVKAGADILVHSVDDREVDDEFVEMLIENKVSYIPTLIVSNNYNKAFSKSYPFTAEDFQYANPYTIGDIQDLKHIADEDLPSFIKRLRVMDYKPRKSEELMGRNLRTLWDKGINIVVGTDAGNIGTLHASSYFEELRAMKRAGLSNAEILKAATVNGGLMLEDEKQGIIAKAHLANLVLLSANPLEDLGTLSSPEKVILRGKSFIPNELLDNSPEALAQRQLNAYNARDIEAFLACYHPDVKVYSYPDQLMYQGKDKMRPGYSGMFENTPNLHCELVNRIVMGNVVVDQERVTGFSNGRVIKAAAIYTVVDGLITEVRFVQ